MLTELFATPIYIGYTTINLVHIEKDIIDMSSEQGVTISNDGGWQSKDHNLSLVNDIVNPHIKKYFRQK